MDELPNLWPIRTEEEQDQRAIGSAFGNIHMVEEYKNITREEVARVYWLWKAKKKQDAENNLRQSQGILDQ